MDPFQLLIKPAAGDCNLACEYCFYRRTTPLLYPAEKRPRMSREVMERAVSDLLSHRFPETIFCWQGGEPTLMGLDFFDAVVDAQMTHGKGGQVVGNAFQTNGILINDDWARFLARYKVVVGLSLDGPREIHDRFRKNLGGEGTFDKVMAAADTLLTRGVATNILCVVNSHNQNRAREVYRFFRAHGFDYIQFIPCLETDGGEVLPFSATPDGLARFFVEAFDEYKREGFPHVSERNFDALMSMEVDGKPRMCTFDKKCGGYLVVEHNGDVYPCDFFVDKEWKLGNVMEAPLATFMSHPLMRRFRKAKKNMAPECKDCGWLEKCYGGCLKDRLPGRAKGPGRTYFCESYKALFETTAGDMKKWVEPLKSRPGTNRADDFGGNASRPATSGRK